MRANRLLGRLWINGLPAAAGFGMLVKALSVYAQDTIIPNPIQAQTIGELIEAISKAVIQVALPIAVIAIIVVGLRLLIASVSGEHAKITESKRMLWWVLIGTAIVVGSSAIALAVVNFARGLGG